MVLIVIVLYIIYTSLCKSCKLYAHAIKLNFFIHCVSNSYNITPFCIK